MTRVPTRASILVEFVAISETIRPALSVVNAYQKTVSIHSLPLRLYQLFTSSMGPLLCPEPTV